jgi:hypothetical protein
MMISFAPQADTLIEIQHRLTIRIPDAVMMGSCGNAKPRVSRISPAQTFPKTFYSSPSGRAWMTGERSVADARKPEIGTRSSCARAD